MIDNCLLERRGQPVYRGDVEREEGRVGRRVEMCWEESRGFGHDGSRETLPPCRSDSTHLPACKTTHGRYAKHSRFLQGGVSARGEKGEMGRKAICVRGNGH